MDAVSSAPLRVLVVEDEPFNRMALQAILESVHYTVLQAANGEEALAVYQKEAIDLILMDVMMPVMDGYEATRRIRQLGAEQMVPVIFLTSSDDDDHLAECIASGGDDFLIKPVTPKILLSKIQAQLRLRDLFNTVKQQKDELDKHRLEDLRGQEIAESIFKRIVHLGCLDESNIPYSTSPAALFNGDILLAARTPNNTLRVMLGDFTGHGFSAAVGAIPTAEMFYKMTHQGHSLSEVITELNSKLNQILPVGLFCAASFAEIDYSEQLLLTWTGGAPDMLRYGNSPRAILQRYESDNLALGVLSADQFSCEINATKICPDETILIYTDGITEASNAEGELFGQEQIEACITDSPVDSWVSPYLHRKMREFCQGSMQDDDMTLIELPCSMATLKCTSLTEHSGNLPSSHWQARLRFDGITLQHTDPLPLLLRNITELQDLKARRSDLYTILAELFNNTLDHGILRLDSSIKSTPEGFMEYFKQREQRLTALDSNDYIDITIENIPDETGGSIHINIQDSSDGFDISRITNKKLEEIEGHSGRGIPLLRNLCESLIFHPPGNRVEAVYKWQ